MTTTTLPTPDAPELLTFLGTGAYTEVPYFDATGEPSDPSEAPDAPVIRTRFIQAALAALHRPSRITVLCTDAAWTKHGDALTAELTALGAPTPEHIRIGGGGSHDVKHAYASDGTDPPVLLRPALVACRDPPAPAHAPGCSPEMLSTRPTA